MYALWKTQGATVQPWRADVRLGAVNEGGLVFVVALADRDWEGRIVFDRPRHRQFMHLPLDYPRINQFPEWFTAEPDEHYRVHLGGGSILDRTGAQLAEGFPIQLEAGKSLCIELHKR